MRAMCARVCATRTDVERTPISVKGPTRSRVSVPSNRTGSRGLISSAANVSLVISFQNATLRDAGS